MLKKLEAFFNNYLIKKLVCMFYLLFVIVSIYNVIVLFFAQLLSENFAFCLVKITC